MSPAELTEKLVALVPPPRVHLSRYFGILSSHSRWRARVILKPHVKKGFVATDDGRGSERMTWSKLLARIFKTDVMRCRACGAKLHPEDFEIVTSGELIGPILLALGLDPVPPPRGPPHRALTLEIVDNQYWAD